MSWKLLNSRTVIDDEWITVRSNDYLTHAGRQIDGYYQVERADFVVIVAECRGRLVLVREYRSGTGKDYLSFPSGQIDAGEDPMTAALRELAEETGYHGRNARLVGTLDPLPAFLRSVGSIVYVEVEDHPAQATTDGEVDAVVLLDWETVLAQARSGEIRDMQAVAALYLVQDLLREAGGRG